MTTTTRTFYKGGNADQKVTATYTDLDTGSVDFGFTDKKGRACGYAWTISQIVCEESEMTWGGYGKAFDVAAGVAVFQLFSNPTRNGKCYGPAFNRAMCHTLEEARRLAVKRAEASKKRDAKKFTKPEAA